MTKNATAFFNYSLETFCESGYITFHQSRSFSQFLFGKLAVQQHSIFQSAVKALRSWVVNNKTDTTVVANFTVLFPMFYTNLFHDAFSLTV